MFPPRKRTPYHLQPLSPDKADTMAASTLILLGWDDIKCRPIYSKAPSGQTKTAASTKRDVNGKGKKSLGTKCIVTVALMNKRKTAPAASVTGHGMEDVSRVDGSITDSKRGGGKRDSCTQEDDDASITGFVSRSNKRGKKYKRRSIQSFPIKHRHRVLQSSLALDDTFNSNENASSPVEDIVNVSLFSDDVSPLREYEKGTTLNDTAHCGELVDEKSGEGSLDDEKEEVPSIDNTIFSGDMMNELSSNDVDTAHDERGEVLGGDGVRSIAEKSPITIEYENSSILDGFEPYEHYYDDDVSPLGSPFSVNNAKSVGGVSSPMSLDGGRTGNGTTKRNLTSEREESSISVVLNDQGHSPSTIQTIKRTTTMDEFDSLDIPFDELVNDGTNSLHMNDTMSDRRRSYGPHDKPNWTSKSKVTVEHKTSDQTAEHLPIGWDDVKGRPIFYAPLPNPKQQKLAEESDVESESSGKDDEAGRKKSKKRVYSSLFKRTGLSKAMLHGMDVDSSPMSTSVRRVTMSTEGGEDVNSDASSVDLVFDLDDIHGNDTVPQVGNGKRTEQDSTPVESTTQPTSNTSLESARAFFKYLDSTHHLTIVNRNDEANTKTDVIRTTRRIEHCDQLRIAYLEYCKTVDDTGVSPITIEEFGMHWNRYFVERGVIRDGLLDED
ncbi:predicted protein [Thalassiosira pseudonana CCMP1335]|uniref:Uncharacterized protein n=1 Tax=Thalassiosira pseudonana TaxID=35128 RepID=B8C5C8_THAPS|nr:predicted protein [Thalassiosira pseudonana CCMP1335]EED91095.1 predicted protein [Thalassiosira pseudonana CCMP1335]